MRNLTFFVVALFMVGNTYAQKGLKLGLQFTPGATMSLQSEDFDKGETLDLDGAFGYNFGLTVGYGISETFSISTGIMFNNHVSQYVHNRQTFSSGATDPNYKKKFSRTLGYVRVPLLIEVGSDPTQSAGFFFRIGPHFDFLTGGAYKDERYVGYSGYDEATGINLREQVDLYQETTLLGQKVATKTGQQGDVYNSFVLGVTLEIGGQIRLTDYLKLILLVHLESSLTNPEGAGAASFAYTVGDRVRSLTNPSDLIKSAEGTPFDASYPNYISEGNKTVTHRDPAWNVMGGLTIGAVYTLDFGN